MSWYHATVSFRPLSSASARKDVQVWWFVDYKEPTRPDTHVNILNILLLQCQCATEDQRDRTFFFYFYQLTLYPASWLCSVIRHRMTAGGWLWHFCVVKSTQTQTHIRTSGSLRDWTLSNRASNEGSRRFHTHTVQCIDVTLRHWCKGHKGHAVWLA